MAAFLANLKYFFGINNIVNIDDARWLTRLQLQKLVTAAIRFARLCLYVDFSQEPEGEWQARREVVRPLRGTSVAD